MRLPGLTNTVAVDWDESMYVLVGREILAGNLPYVAIFQEKPLGAPVMISIAMALSGQSVIGLRVLGLVAVAVTCLLLRGIVISAGLGRFAGLMAGLFYAATSIRLGGMTLNTELLVVPFNTAAFTLALRHADAPDSKAQLRAIAGIGALFGVAIWLKYLPAFPACALFAVLVGRWWWRGLVGMGGIAVLAGVYFVLCWLPTILSGAFYWWIGQWDVFWFCNFGFMPLYVGTGRPALEVVVSIAIFGLQAGVVLLFGIAGIMLWRDAPGFVLVVAAWLVAETVATSAPGRFYDHYFIGMLPPLCLLSGFAVPALARRLLRPARLERLSRLPPASAAGVAIVLALVLLGTGRLAIAVPNYSAEIARIIRADPEPGATVWTINTDPIIYFLLGQPLPSRYAMPPHVVSSQSVLMRSDPLDEVKRILATRPRYLLYDPKRGPLLLPAMQDHLAAVVGQDYRLVARVPGDEFEIDVYRLRE